MPTESGNTVRISLGQYKNICRLLSYMQCDMECPTEPHYQDCLLSQARNAVGYLLSRALCAEEKRDAE